MLIDLQTHSTYSDGAMTPTELANFMASLNIKITALTDHNTVGGLAEFKNACAKKGIKAINGVELYSRLGHKKFNLLWYNFDKNDPGLHDLLRYIQQKRRNKARLILNKLKKKGYEIDTEKILDQFNHYIPINGLVYKIISNKKNHHRITKELKEKNPREEKIMEHLFFNKKNKKRDHLRETHVDIIRILKLRKKIGGQLILNHPGKYGKINKDFIFKLKKLGIDGIEVLSPHHSLGAIMYLQAISREFNFAETGGSDFHLDEGNKYPLQNAWQYFTIKSEFLRNIKKIIK